MKRNDPAHDYVMDEAERNHSMAPNQLVRAHIEADPGGAVRREVAEIIWEVKTAEFMASAVLALLREAVIVADKAARPGTVTRLFLPPPGCSRPIAGSTTALALRLFGRFTLLVLGDRDGGCGQRSASSSSPNPAEVVV
jgi:hypothetical protein